MKTLLLSFLSIASLAGTARAGENPVAACYEYTGQALHFAGSDFTCGPDAGTYDTPVGKVEIARRLAKVNLAIPDVWTAGQNPDFKADTVPSGLATELRWQPDSSMVGTPEHCPSGFPTQPGRYLVWAYVTDKNWVGWHGKTISIVAPHHANVHFGGHLKWRIGEAVPDDLVRIEPNGLAYQLRFGPKDSYPFSSESCKELQPTKPGTYCAWLVITEPNWDGEASLYNGVEVLP